MTPQAPTPPQIYQDTAAEILSEPGEQLDLVLILTLANTLWSLYKECKRANLIQAVRHAREHPHGLIAMGIRHRLLHELPLECQTDATWHSALTVLGRLVDAPEGLPPEASPGPPQ